MSLTVKEIKGYDNIHAQRLAGATLKFGEVEFDVKPLSTAQYSYIQATGSDGIALTADWARFGVTAVRGLDAEWETVTINGRECKALTLGWINELVPGVLGEIGQAVSNLSAFGTLEARALDFT